MESLYARTSCQQDNIRLQINMKSLLKATSSTGFDTCTYSTNQPGPTYPQCLINWFVNYFKRVWFKLECTRSYKLQDRDVAATNKWKVCQPVRDVQVQDSGYKHTYSTIPLDIDTVLLPAQKS